MALQIKYFASLRERMGRDGDSIDNTAKMNRVADVWSYVSGDKPFPANMQYADLTQEVKDGDEVAFFPPVTGG
jgi:molybdopterin synthase sulfur carrier subunit